MTQIRGGENLHRYTVGEPWPPAPRLVKKFRNVFHYKIKRRSFEPTSFPSSFDELYEEREREKKKEGKSVGFLISDYEIQCKLRREREREGKDETGRAIDFRVFNP